MSRPWARSTCRDRTPAPSSTGSTSTRSRRLPVGKARYGLMLREDGFVFDDGTTSRLADDRFFMTTTTANAARVMQHMEFCHQVLWPELDVQFVSVTEQWAQFSIAGPQVTRRAAARCVDAPVEYRNAALSLSWRAPNLTVCGGIPARLFRISFSGELAYEIGVPARYGDAADPRAHGGRRATSASCPTAPKRSASCASRKAMSPATSSTAAPPPTISASAA